MQLCCQKKSAPNLGAILDNTLNMDLQVTNVCKSCYMYLRWIGQIRKFLNNDSAIKLVHAFITSKIDNLNGLLIKLPNNKIKRLQRILNSAARIVTRTQVRDHITPILKQLHWLPIPARIEYKILLTTFKALNGLAPEYLEQLVSFRKYPKATKSSKLKLLYEPVMRLTTVGDRSFYAYAPKIWNTVPFDIRTLVSTECFKSALKTFLFRKYY